MSKTPSELKGSPPLRLQLQDPVFRQWMARSPLRKSRPDGHKNWRVYVKVKRKSGWRKVKNDFATYKEAYAFLAKHHKDVYDIAICSKLPKYAPPVNEDGHTVIYPSPHPNDWWCGFCRRVTRFKYFKKHHIGRFMSPNERHCEICGARFVFATQQFDIMSTPNPPKSKKSKKSKRKKK